MYVAMLSVFASNDISPRLCHLSALLPYKYLEGFEELGRIVIRPDIGEVPFQVINEDGRGVVGPVVPDTKYGGIHPM